MEETRRPETLLIERTFAPNRLAEDILVGIYDRVLQVVTEHKDHEPIVGRLVDSQPEHVTRTGGRS